MHLESYAIPYAGLSTDDLTALVQTQEQLSNLHAEYLAVKQSLEGCVKPEQPNTQEEAFIRAAEPLIQAYYVSPFAYERWAPAILKKHYYDLVCLKRVRDNDAEQEAPHSVGEVRRNANIQIDRAILRISEIAVILKSKGVAV